MNSNWFILLGTHTKFPGVLQSIGSKRGCQSLYSRRSEQKSDAEPTCFCERLSNQAHVNVGNIAVVLFFLYSGWSSKITLLPKQDRHRS